jgi:hypothetical protein
MRPAASIGMLVAALACACADDGLPPGDPMFRAGGSAVDGTGFVDLAAGAEVELVPGAQGGFHVWVNVGVQGMTGEYVLEREARQADDGDLILHAITQTIEVPEEAMED